MVFWRNSKIGGFPPLFSAIFKYVWVVPGIWAYFYWLAYQASDTWWEKKRIINNTVEMLAGENSSLLFWVAGGFVFWVITILVQLRPAFKIKNGYLKINSYGLLYDGIELDNIKRISVFSLGPFGSLLDIKTQANLNWRVYGFLFSIKKDKLSEYLKEVNPEIV